MLNFGTGSNAPVSAAGIGSALPKFTGNSGYGAGTQLTPASFNPGTGTTRFQQMYNANPAGSGAEWQKSNYTPNTLERKLEGKNLTASQRDAWSDGNPTSWDAPAMSIEDSQQYVSNLPTGQSLYNDLMVDFNHWKSAGGYKNNLNPDFDITLADWAARESKNRKQYISMTDQWLAGEAANPTGVFRGRVESRGDPSWGEQAGLDPSDANGRTINWMDVPIRVYPKGLWGAGLNDGGLVRRGDTQMLNEGGIAGVLGGQQQIPQQPIQQAQAGPQGPSPDTEPLIQAALMAIDPNSDMPEEERVEILSMFEEVFGPGSVEQLKEEYMGNDEVPAMLTPGEVVIPKNKVNEAGGADNLMAMVDELGQARGGTPAQALSQAGGLGAVLGMNDGGMVGLPVLIEERK